MDYQLEDVLYFIQQILTNNMFVLCICVVLAIPIFFRFKELKNWNSGTCKLLNKKWKKHSMYKNGATLYVSNQYHIIVSYDHLINLPKYKQVTMLLLLFCMLLTLAVCPLITLTLKYFTLSSYLITGLLLLPALIYNCYEIVRKFVR